jgi:hypothetical protein
VPLGKVQKIAQEIASCVGAEFVEARQQAGHTTCTRPRAAPKNSCKTCAVHTSVLISGGHGGC